MELKQRIKQGRCMCTHTHTLEESLERSFLYINFSNEKGNEEVLCKSNYPHYPWKKILNKRDWKDDEIRK